MIKLTKLNNQSIVLNALYLERVEAIPDTVITFTTGKKILVRESVEEVTQLVTTFYQKINLFQKMKEGLEDV